MSLPIDAILTHAGYEIGLHFQLRKVYKVDPLTEVLEWLHPTDPYPSQGQLDTWEAQAQAIIDASLALSTAKAALKLKIELAKTYKTEIATLWNTCLDQLETNASHPTRFNNVLAAVNALPTALKNRVNKGTPDPANASTDALKDIYVDHVHLVAVSLVTLLSFA